MATYIPYTPTGVIAKALFNFDAFGPDDYKLTGTVNVSVSDSFTFAQYLAAFPLLSSNTYTSLSSGNAGWTASHLANINLVTSTYSNFINLTFSTVANYSGFTPANVGNASDINISAIYRSDLTFSGLSALGTDTSFGYAGSRGDIVLNAFGLSDVSLDLTSFGGHALMHEIGHSLGLSHPHSSIVNGIPTITADYAATTTLGFDKLGFHINSLLDMYKEYFSIMSYDDQTPAGAPDTFAQTPMILDVIALQSAYGEGHGSSGTGNDVVTAGGGGAVNSYRTYFDTGGIDTINLENYVSGAYLHMGTTIVGAAHLVGVSMTVADANTMINLGGDPPSLRWFYGEYENATGSSNADILIGNSLDNSIGGLAGLDYIDGDSGNDELNGGDGNDEMYGGLGDDRFDWDASQRAGDDTMYGETGNDTYVISGNDQVIEFSSEGVDLIWTVQSYSLASLPYVENLSLFGTAAANLTGNDSSFGNTLVGNAADNIIDGRAGADTMIGGAGNDTYIVDNVGDVVTEQANEGSDTVQSTAAAFDLNNGLDNLTLSGTAGYEVGNGNAANNNINGSTNDDRLFGEQGNDNLFGSSGQDHLEGGTGADTFTYQSVSESTPTDMDRIVDFVSGLDKIDLSGIDADASLSGDQAFTFIGNTAFSGTASELRFSNWQLYGDTNGDGAADFMIKVLGVETILSSDFIL